MKLDDLVASFRGGRMVETGLRAQGVPPLEAGEPVTPIRDHPIHWFRRHERRRACDN
ncbi:MAG: hypothetical protein ACRDTR_04125 [Rubrobacter sp.]